MIKKYLFALTLFLGTLCTLGQFYNRWWFNGADDFHCVYVASKTKTCADTLKFLADGHPLHDAGPSNADRTYTRTTFMNTYYRPLQLILSTWLYWIFDTQAYGFFLFNVLLHALNTTLLFFLLSLLTPLAPSFFACIFFAFHPQIAYRFGSLANIQYYLGTFFVLIILLMLIRLLRRQTYWLIIPMSALFFLALLCREVYIVLPAILFLLSPCFSNKQSWRPTIYALAGVSLTALIYLGLRLYLYPFQLTQGAPHTHTLKTLIGNKIPELLIFFYDSLWLSWLPWGNKILKLIFVLPMLGMLTTLFIYNTKKLWVLCALASTGLMLWPGIIGHYSPRYFYDMAPFVLLAYVLLFTYYTGPGKQCHKTIQALMLIPCIFLILFSLDSFNRRATKLHTAKTAIENLLNDPAVRNRPICFLSYPADVLGDQPAEICWVLQKEHQTPIYCDTATSLVQADSHIVTPTRWLNLASEYYDKNYVTTTPVDNGFTYTSLDPQKMHFLLTPGGFSLGKKIINKIEPVHGEIVITDFTLVIDAQYREQNPVYVTWDYEKKRFIL